MAHGDEISYEELENIQKLFGLKQENEWDDDIIINSIFTMLLHLGEHKKLSKTRLFRYVKSEITESQFERIIIAMQN